MLRAVLILALLIAAPAAAEGPGTVVRTHTAEIAAPPADLAARLAGRLPEDAQPVSLPDGTVILAYAGLDMPVFLAEFLAENVPTLDAATLKPGFPVNVSLMMMPEGDGTALRLMAVEPAARQGDGSAAEQYEAIFGGPMPEGAELILTEGGSDLVLSFKTGAKAAADGLEAQLTQAGYTVARSGEEDPLLLADNGQGGAVFVYIRPDPETPGHAVVVVRRMED